MIELLSKVNVEYLKREIDRIPLIHSVITSEEIDNEEELAKILISYYGYDLLRQRGIRHAVLTTLSNDVLIRISKLLKYPERRSIYDSALMLSGENWIKSSKLPGLLDNLLFEVHRVRIPQEYMPDYQFYTPPRWEDIVADNLPSLFEYQMELSNQLIQLLTNYRSRCMLQMPTGSGKTRTVVHAMIHSDIMSKVIEGKYIIWLAHTEELCEQAIDAFRRSWIEYGNGVVRYHRLFGSRELNEMELRGGLIFCSLQKLYSIFKRGKKEYEIISTNCELLVFDEAHKALAPTYKELITSILNGSHTARLIGLSATPGRSTVEISENRRLARLFGENLIRYQTKESDSVEKLRQLGILATLERKEIEGIRDFQLTSREKSHVRQYMELPPSALKKIGNNQERNAAIVNEVVNQIELGNQCLVFACSVEHAKLIAAMIGLRNIKAGSITGDMRKATRSKIITKFNDGEIMAITNYGILTTGYDAPRIGAIIITRPTGSIILYSQMIGRGLRGPKVGGKETCILVDVVDNIIGFGEIEDVYNHFLGYWN